MPQPASRSASGGFGRCEGTADCPPRCPRFVDECGEPFLIEPLEASRVDVDGLASMYVDYPDAHRTMGLPPATRDRIDAWLERLCGRGFNVADRDGRPVGHAAYAPRSKVEPQFVVFVDPDFHDRGIGSELCRHLIAYAADAGRDALVLDVDAANERAVRVYRRLGFETVARSGSEPRMRLPFDEPIADAVRLPPAERPPNARSRRAERGSVRSLAVPPALGVVPVEAGAARPVGGYRSSSPVYHFLRHSLPCEPTA